MAEQQTDITPTTEELILSHLKENGQSVAWLATKIGCSGGHLHLVLKLTESDRLKRVLSDGLKSKINTILKTNF